MRLFNRIFKRTLASPRNRLASALLNLNFLSGNLDNRITFGRTTNATVTNAQGLIANAPMNLLTFSEQFDNAAWTKSNVTVTANSLASPDGAVTADTLVRGASTTTQATLRVTTTQAISTAYTLSVYVKAGTAGAYLYVRNLAVNDTLPNGLVVFNPATGLVVSAGSAYTSATMLSVGNGWYRCVVTGTTPASIANNLVDVGTCNASGVVTGGTGDSIYLWGAQLELGSTATTYNPTTVKNLLGFTENFDNAAWTKSNAFVQTNLLTNSEAFENAAWDKASATISANSATAPNGTVTADKIVSAAATAATGVGQTITFAAATYTGSVYAKASEARYVQLLWNSTASTNYANFDLQTGTVTAGTYTSATITSVGDGWYRLTITSTLAAGSGGLFAWLQNSGTAIRAVSYTGNGTDGIYIWGAQLVQGTSAGDYKATYAAAAAVGYTDIYGQPFAQKLVEDTTAGAHYAISAGAITFASYSGGLVFSCYAKAAERSKFLVGYSSAGNLTQTNCIFDLVAKTATVTNAFGWTVATGSISDVGSGWYRCSFRVSTGGSAYNPNPTLAVIGSAGTISYTGDGTSGIYIFGAQLSDSASVDPYVYQPVAAPSSVAYYGPRFDYDPVTLAPKGLLIEEQRTNLLTYSEQVDNAVWTKASVTATANTTVSPDGTANAETLTENTTGGEHVAFQQVSKAATAITYTHSIYYKAGSGSRNIGVAITDGTLGGLTAIFSTSGSVVLASQVVGTATGWTAVGAAVTAVGNGWFRASFTATTNTATRVDGVVYLVDGTTRSYTGNGTSSLLIYGAQLEAGAFATSYIPTVASQVTRAADSASMIGNNFARWYNQTQGTVYAEFLLNSTAGTFPSAYSINDGTANNRIQPYQNSALTSIGFDITTGGAAQAAINITVPSLATAYVRHAGVYQTNSAVAAANGTLGTEDTSVTLAPYNRLGLGSNSLAQNANCWIKRFAYYPRRLSNTELQGITS